MPWQNNDSNGPWGSGGGGPRNPWGGGDGPNPPNLDDLLRRGQEKLRASLPGGQGGNIIGFILGGLLILWLVSSSFYRVNTDEVGIVMRFGQFVRQTAPGLNIKLPSPIETVIKPKVTKDNFIEIGTADGSSENLVVTGDQNIVNIAYTVRWKIKDAPKFLFTLENPESTIQEVAESAMREAIASTPLIAAIGDQRAQVAAAVERRLQDVLDSYGAGIEISGVFFKQVDPPAAVEQAFKDVSAAQQDAQRFTNQANAYRQQLVARAQGEAARFNAVYAQYKLAPEVTRKRIYLETMEDVLRGMDKVVVDSNGSGVVPYLPLPELKKRREAAAQASE